MRCIGKGKGKSFVFVKRHIPVAAAALYVTDRCLCSA